ncbi:secreted RxLR effector protein 161-like [Benincasa hispida]|uniref:secreted RxLR effector protein 161-like n=1 Tax=Benincasa hispida TaxID=102211 RepID=UPI00190007B4|nr:secreted RxLR effector protein 161-like [Benincasa hispida]
MTDLGFMSYFLGMEIKQGQDEVFICQKKYVKEILKKFQMDECKTARTLMNQKEKLCKEDGVVKVDEGYFRSLIDCLMYLIVTRPEILNVVSILSRFMHCASELHLKVAKRVIRYVKSTSDFGIKFTSSKEFKLIGFSDSDWGSSIDDMRSTSDYCFTLGSSVLSWSSKKQETVAQSTAEAEFIVAIATKECTEILVDNQAAIVISHNPVFHGKTKHLNIKLFFLREV